MRLVLLLLLVPAGVFLGVTTYLTWMRLRYVGYHRHHERPLPTPTLWDALRVQAREIGALTVMGWWHVVGRRTEGRAVPSVPLRGPPVLCVHGFMQNATNWVGLGKHLAARGRVVETVSLGRPPRDQDRYADRLEAALSGLTRDYPGPVDVVCHSMGGIVLRRVLQRRPELASRLRRVVTIATPHEGTAATRGLGRVLPEARAMARGAPWLQALPTLSELAPQARLTTLGSPDDTTVYPVESTRAPGGEHVEVPGIGHSGMVVWWESLGRVIEALEREEGDAAPRPSGGDR